MAEFEDKISQLQTRLGHLEKYEAAFKREIRAIRNEIDLLKSQNPLPDEVENQQSQRETQTQKSITETGSPVPPIITHQSTAESHEDEQKTILRKESPEVEKRTITRVPLSTEKVSSISEAAQANIEKFIGENLISKIGIIVLVIGVAIGAKYAIDNNYVSPLMRILFGYLVGLVLNGLALKLKAKYHNYSAVLMSGGMAIMYFITYFAYSYYALMSQLSAFSLMVIFTIFTVLAAIIYNSQVIAHLGLVGAYAIPFLLSTGSGRYDILFSYIAIINIGILAVSVKKYWKPIFYTSFAFTWLIFAVWYFDKFDYSIHFSLSNIFLLIFFLTFYITFLAYKLLHDETFQFENIFLILANTFIFYCFGYSILESAGYSDYLGLFTIFNAFNQFIFGFLIYKFKLGDQTIFYLISVLVLFFMTIFVPIQFNGHLITLLWMGEALFLFIVGRIKQISLFEYFSYPVLVATLISLFKNWLLAQIHTNTSMPMLNEQFATSLIVSIGFGLITFINRGDSGKIKIEKEILWILKILFPTVFLIVLYNTFRTEIGVYYHNLQLVNETSTGEFEYISHFQLLNIIWQINYTLLFLTVLSFINISKFKSAALGYANLILNCVMSVVFLLFGLIILNELNDLYLNQVNSNLYFILIRYISYGFLAALIVTSYLHIRRDFITRAIAQKYLQITFDSGLSFITLVIISNELLLWSEYFRLEEFNRLGLSILFGLYALFLIVIGIIYKKQHLRIFAIVLFALTLVKLFLFDISELGTISKTIVFVSVGILLLIASFIYTKYRSLIFNEDII
jgi:uncharacterized membrane protein